MRLDRTKAKYTKKDIAFQPNVKKGCGIFRAKVLGSGSPILSLQVSFGLGTGLDGVIFTGF